MRGKDPLLVSSAMADRAHAQLEFQAILSTWSNLEPISTFFNHARANARPGFFPSAGVSFHELEILVLLRGKYACRSHNGTPMLD